MTKQEMAKSLADGEGCTIQVAMNFIDNIFGLVSDCLEHGESVKIRGFGTFTVCEREAREFKNPRTKKVDVLPKRKSPMFIPSRQLKKCVKEGG